MTVEYSPSLVPLETIPIQATAGEIASGPADWEALDSTSTHDAPTTTRDVFPPDDEVRALRQARIDQLRVLQGELLTSPADPALVATSAPKFLHYADDVYAARSERELVLVGLQVDQLQCAWEQFRRMMVRRDRARRLAVAFLLAVFGFLVAITAFDEHFQLDVTQEIRLLQVPVYVVVWSTIGGICSLLYRFNRSADVEMEDPMRVLLTRPLMGAVLGSFSYLLVQLGFLTLSSPGSVPGDAAATAAPLAQNARVVHLMIVVAFIVGFSDRLSEAILKSLVGSFGGDRTGELVSPDGISPPVNPSALTAILNVGGSGPAGYVAASTDAQRMSATTSSSRVAGPSDPLQSDRPGPFAADGQAPVIPAPAEPLGRPVQPVIPPPSGSTTTGP